MVVDLIDASGNDMVWRGVATDILSSQTKKHECKLNKAIKTINTMFKTYPSKKS